MTTLAEAFSKLWHSIIDNRRSGCPDISLFDLKCRMALALAQLDSSDRHFNEKLLISYVGLESAGLDGITGLLEQGGLVEQRPSYPEAGYESTPEGDKAWLAYHEALDVWEAGILSETLKLLNKLVSEGALFVDSRGAYTLAA